MSSNLPLTRPAPWTDIPGMEPLWPELAFPGERPIQVTVTVPDGGGRRPVMDIVTTQDRAVDDFATAFAYAQEADGFDVHVRRYAG
jgi:hypothetical protein